MGIRPNGDVTPCPYLPVFGGNLRSASLADLLDVSELFAGIRGRTALGGRCGACELNGPAAAAAPGLRHDRRVMAEDPSARTAGTFAGLPLLAPTARPRRRARASRPDTARIADDNRVGRRRRRAHEEDPGVRPRDGRPSRRGVLPQRGLDRVTSKISSGSGADADAEDLRSGVAIIPVGAFPASQNAVQAVDGRRHQCLFVPDIAPPCARTQRNRHDTGISSRGIQGAAMIGTTEVPRLRLSLVLWLAGMLGVVVITVTALPQLFGE